MFSIYIVCDPKVWDYDLVLMNIKKTDPYVRSLFQLNM